MKVRHDYASPVTEREIDRAEHIAETVFKTLFVVLGLGLLLAQGYLRVTA